MTVRLAVSIGVDDPAGVRVARRAVTDAIRCWDVRPGVADEVGLVVSELLTNAQVHGRSDAELRLLHDDSWLRVEVADQDTRLPVLVAPDTQSLSGRGLAIVAALTNLWGIERTPSGKLVWAEFDLSDRRHP